MKRLVIAVLLAPSAVLAEPPESVRAGPDRDGQDTRYVEGGLLFGAAEPVIGWNVMPTVDGGVRISNAWWIHAGLGYGRTIDNLGSHGPNGGSNGLVRAGLETRWCSAPHGALCAIAGADLGATHGTWSAGSAGEVVWSNAYGAVDSTTSNALVAIPHVAIDFGGDVIRVRMGLEADLALLERTTSQLGTAEMTESRPGFIGIELAAGVVYQW